MLTHVLFVFRLLVLFIFSFSFFLRLFLFFFFFFFNDTATTEIYTLSLHDALPIFLCTARDLSDHGRNHRARRLTRPVCVERDRKSTRLNSSHVEISYAVFCLKKKKKNKKKNNKKKKKKATKKKHIHRYNND